MVMLLCMHVQPDYELVENEAAEKAKSALSLPDSEWKVKCDSGGCKVSVRKSDAEDSNIVIVKTQVNIARPMEKVYVMYNDLSLWPNWSKDTTFRTVEEVSEKANVMNVSYKTPIIDNRDCVYYSCRMDGSPIDPSSTTSKYLSIDADPWPRRSLKVDRVQKLGGRPSPCREKKKRQASCSA